MKEYSEMRTKEYYKIIYDWFGLEPEIRDPLQIQSRFMIPRRTGDKHFRGIWPQASPSVLHKSYAGILVKLCVLFIFSFFVKRYYPIYWNLVVRVVYFWLFVELSPFHIHGRLIQMGHRKSAP